MSTPPAWYRDPRAVPDSGVFRWWDGDRWTEHTQQALHQQVPRQQGPRQQGSREQGARQQGPEAAPSPVAGTAPVLDDDEVERLAEWLAAGQKQRDRDRLEGSIHDWFDPEEIDADTRLLLRELVRHLPPGARPLELRRGARGPLVALTANHIVVVTKPRRSREDVEVVSTTYDRLDLRASEHPVASVKGDARRLTVTVPREEWGGISAFIVDPQARVDRVAQILGAARRPAEAPAPNWYPDPGGHHAERFWDGYAWAAEGIGDPMPAAQRQPPPGPPAFDDATIDHIVEGLVADRVLDELAIALADAWGDGGPSIDTGKFGWQMARRWRALQAQFPAGDPPCDFHDEVVWLIVVSARRTAVVQMAGDRPVVDADLHERVELTKARTFGSNVIDRRDGRLLVPASPVGRKWMREFRGGPRSLQGSLQELLARPRRAPGDPKAGWFADPMGRYHQRFWNGTAWTADVIARKGRGHEQLTDKQFR